MSTAASYVNATATTSSPETKLLKRDSYVDTATALVQSVLPSAEFRVSDSYVGNNGISHVYFKQTLFGLDIDNADFNVNIAKDGTVFSHGNSFFTGTVPETSPLQKRDFQDSVAALTGASSTLQLGVSTEDASVVATDRIETYTITGTSGAKADPEARLVYFAKEDGTLALAWRVETDLGNDWLLSYVDAQDTATVHGVVNYVADIDASYLVYKWGINDPDEAVALNSPREVIENPWDLRYSPLTWLSDGSDTYDSTLGNNALSQANPEGETCILNDKCYLDNYRPESTSYSFEYSYSTTTKDPSSYYDASVTQLFYTVNTYHDLLYSLGFTEASYNFQVDNEGLGGSGNDWAITSAQDGSGTNNANFATPPDGKPGRMRMYLWTQSTIERDCAFEAGVIIHEYTHGLSNRLTGGGSNTGCLSGTEDGGMGEGWGDFMATAIRVKTTDTRDTDYAMGAWVYNDDAGIRAYLYSTDLTTNPQTYASVNSMTAVHDIGTVWANILYEVFWNLADKYGLTDAITPTFDADGVPTDGRFLTMKLVVDGMALQPCNPTFVSARDAIIDADEALTGGANACELWTGFAKRGLGSGAVYASKKRTESYTVPSGVC